jgi:hypothetical protein
MFGSLAHCEPKTLTLGNSRILKLSHGSTGLPQAAQ